MAKRIVPLSACAALARLTPAAAMTANATERNLDEIFMMRTPQNRPLPSRPGTSPADQRCS
jgi:hypothetical protein